MDKIKQLLAKGLSDPLLKGSTTAFSVNVLGLGLGLLSQVTLARTLGGFGYGTYEYILSWIAILTIFGTMGLDSNLLRFIPAYLSEKKWAEVKGINQFSTALCFLACVFLGLVSSYFVLHEKYDLTSDAVKQGWIAGCVLLPIWCLNNLRQQSLRALKEIFYARFPDVVVRPLIIVLILLMARVLYKAELSASFALATHALAAFLIFVWGSQILAKKWPPEVLSSKPLFLFRSWTTSAGALMFVSGMHIVLSEMDKVMIGLILGIQEVGVYSAASKIAMLVLFGMHAVNTIAAPMISEYHATKNRSELQEHVTKASLWIFWVSIPIFICVILFGQFVLGLFGESFAQAYPALVLLSFGQLINISVGPVGFLLTMTGHQKESLKILLFTLGFNLLLNLPAIYFFGINGAALVTGLMIALRNVLAWRATKRILGVDSSVLVAFLRVGK